MTVNFFKILTLVGLVQGFASPYHAALIVDGERFCSGALISKHHVITTANCVYKAFEVNVILHSTNLFERVSQSFVSSSYQLHDKYKSENDHIYNIALIRLPVSADDVMNPLKLSQPDYTGRLTITGFDNAVFGQQEVGVEEGTCERFSLCVRFNDSFVPLVPKDGSVINTTNKFRNVGSPVVDNNDALIGLVVKMEDNATLAIKINPFVQWIQGNIQ